MFANGGAAGGDPAIWRDMPDAWTLVPGLPSCPLYVADVKRVQVPTKIWSSCGPGCQVTSANALSSDKGTGVASATGALVNGEVFVRLVSGAPGYSLAHIWRLSDGHVVAAALQRPVAGCGVMGWSRSAPQVIPWSIPEGRGRIVATSRLDDSPLVWSPLLHDLPVHSNIFANDLGWGMTFEDGTVRFETPLDAPEMTVLEQSALNQRAAARRDLTVWTSAVTNMPDVLKGFRPSEQVKIAVAGTRRIINVALSDTAMVWIAASGPSINEGLNEYAEFSWSGWPDNLSAVQVRGTVPIPGKDNSSLLSLATGGDYAAVDACMGTRCRLLVLKLSTGKIWEIPYRPNAGFTGTLAVSDREVLVGESDVTAPPNILERLVRLEVARLDEIQTAW